MRPCTVCGGADFDIDGRCSSCRNYIDLDNFKRAANHHAVDGEISNIQHREFSDSTFKNKKFLFVLVVFISFVILFVVTGRTGNDDKKTDDSLVNKCLQGRWNVTDVTMDIWTEKFGLINVRNVGSVGTVEYGGDGRSVYNYGQASRFIAETGVAKKLAFTIQGIVRYEVATTDNTISFSNILSEAKMAISVVDTGSSTVEDFRISDKPAKYTCQADSLAIFAEDYHAEAQRDL